MTKNFLLLLLFVFYHFLVLRHLYRLDAYDVTFLKLQTQSILQTNIT